MKQPELYLPSGVRIADNDDRVYVSTPIDGTTISIGEAIQLYEWLMLYITRNEE